LNLLQPTSLAFAPKQLTHSLTSHTELDFQDSPCYGNNIIHLQLKIKYAQRLILDILFATLGPSITTPLFDLLQGRTQCNTYAYTHPYYVLTESVPHYFLFPFLSTQHAPGVPKILVGNRLHLAYKRQVTTEQAQVYAERLGVTFFEVSPLCNFNITESFTELARIVLMRHGMERLWRPIKVLSLQDLCCRSIVSCTPVHLVDKLPLPLALKSHLKSFSMANGLNARMMHGRSYSVTTTAANTTHIATKRTGCQLLKKKKLFRPPPLSPAAEQSCTGKSCKIS
uniref:small monomeric GTPase n=1 Tax=Oncorhynchus mykiss TaxID=8022 RepID=A0A8C7V6F1_ONCMY